MGNGKRRWNSTGSDFNKQNNYFSHEAGSKHRADFITELVWIYSNTHPWEREKDDNEKRQLFHNIVTLPISNKQNQTYLSENMGLFSQKEIPCGCENGIHFLTRIEIRLFRCLMQEHGLKESRQHPWVLRSESIECKAPSVCPFIVQLEKARDFIQKDAMLEGN